MDATWKLLLALTICLQTLGHQDPEQDANLPGAGKGNIDAIRRLQNQVPAQDANLSEAKKGNTEGIRRKQKQQHQLPEEAPGVSEAEEGVAKASRRLQASRQRVGRVVSFFTGAGVDTGDGEGQNFGVQLWLNLLGNFVWCVLQLAVAVCIYNSMKDERLTIWPSRVDLDGVLNCGADMNSLCGCCCGLIRTAQTQHAAGLRQFWPSLLILILCYMLPSLVGYIALSSVRLYFRSSLRSAAGLDPDCCNDCLMVFCCCPCSV